MIFKLQMCFKKKCMCKRFQLDLTLLTPFLVISYHHTHTFLSPHKQLLSCSSKASHPHPALRSQTGCIYSTTSFSLPFPPPGIKYPVTPCSYPASPCYLSSCPAQQWKLLQKPAQRKSLIPGQYIIVFVPQGFGFNRLLQSLSLQLENNTKTWHENLRQWEGFHGSLAVLFFLNQIILPLFMGASSAKYHL